MYRKDWIYQNEYNVEYAPFNPQTNLNNYKWQSVVLVLLPNFRLFLYRKGSKQIDIHLRHVRTLYSSSASQLILTLIAKAGIVLHWKSSGDGDKDRQGFDELISHIRAQYALYFPLMPVLMVDDPKELLNVTSTCSPDGTASDLKICLIPNLRMSHLSEQYPHVHVHKPIIGPTGGFVRAYLAMCDFYDVLPRDKIMWTMEILYAETDQRRFSLTDFDDIEGRDCLPIIHALEFNSFFEELIIEDYKVTVEIGNAILAVLQRNQSIKKIVLSKIILPKDYLVALFEALSSNESPALSELQLDEIALDERSVASLANLIPRLPFRTFRVTNCQLNKKTILPILSAIRRTTSNGVTSVLQTLDLSGETLGQEGLLTLAEFLAQPNCLEDLRLENCGLSNIDILFGALARGGNVSLKSLNLNGNKLSHDSLNTFNRFLSICQGLKQLNIESCKLSDKFIEQLLLGLAANTHLYDLSLSLKSNELGLKSSIMFLQHLSKISCLSSLDLSDNQFDGDSGFENILNALKANGGLRRIILNRVLVRNSSFATIALKDTSKKAEKNANKPDLQVLCTIDKLEHLSLSDNGLNSIVNRVLRTFVELSSNNQCYITHLNLSKNQLGQREALALSRFLPLITSLEELLLEENQINLPGWQALANGLQHSFSIKKLPIPISDFSSFLKFAPVKTNEVVELISRVLRRNLEMQRPTQISSDGKEALRKKTVRASQYGVPPNTTYSAHPDSITRLSDQLRNSLGKVGPLHPQETDKIRKISDEALENANALPQIQKGINGCIQNVIETRVANVKSELSRVLQSTVSKENWWPELIERVTNYSLLNARTIVGGIYAIDDSVRREIKYVVDESNSESSTIPLDEISKLIEMEVHSYLQQALLPTKVAINTFLHERVFDQLKAATLLVDPIITEQQHVRLDSNTTSTSSSPTASTISLHKTMSPSSPITSPAAKKPKSQPDDIGALKAVESLIETPALLHANKTRPKVQNRRAPRKQPITCEDIERTPTTDKLQTNTSPPPLAARPSAFTSFTKQSTQDENVSADKSDTEIKKSLENLLASSPSILQGIQRETPGQNIKSEPNAPIELVQRKFAQEEKTSDKVNKSEIRTSFLLKSKKPSTEFITLDSPNSNQDTLVVPPDSPAKIRFVTSAAAWSEPNEMLPHQEPKESAGSTITQERIPVQTKAEIILPIENVNNSSTTFSQKPSGVTANASNAVTIADSPPKLLPRPTTFSASMDTGHPANDLTVDSLFPSPKKNGGENSLLSGRDKHGSHPNLAISQPLETTLISNQIQAKSMDILARQVRGIDSSTGSLNIRGKTDIPWDVDFFKWLQAMAKKQNIQLTSTTNDANLTDYVSDGVSLLRIMDAISGPIKYRKTALLPVHKIDNLNVLLSHLKDKANVGGSIGMVTAEDLLKGDTKKIILLMNAITKQYPIE